MTAAEYEYAPLLYNEIRLVKLYPGNDDDVLCCSLIHEILTVPTPSNSQRLGPKALQKTLPYLWKACETPEGKTFFSHGSDVEPTTFEHPDKNIDAALYSQRPRPSFSGSEYEALSYTWEPALPPSHVLIHRAEHNQSTCNGTDLSRITVGANLATALKQLRLRDRVRTLWIDQISINQRDLEERGQQVRRIGSIFSLAARVVVWLGPASADSELALNTLRYLGEQIEITTSSSRLRAKGAKERDWHLQDCQLPYAEYRWTALRRLLKREWFSRLWVVQEIALANANAVVQCGGVQIPFYNLRRAAVLLSERKVKYRIENMLARSARGPAYGEQSLKIMDLILMGRELQCSDPRDKVYAMLSMMSDSLQEAISPDYAASASTVYRDFTLAYSRHSGRLDLLSTCWKRKEAFTGPSWVPDLSSDEGFELRMAFCFQAAGMSKASFEHDGSGVLAVEGIKHGEVVAVSRSTDEATAFPDLYAQLGQDLDETYPTGERRFDAWLRTLNYDRFAERLCDSAIEPAFEDFCLAARRRLADSEEVLGETFGANVALQVNRIGRTLCSLGFIQTSEGYYGLANVETRPGDIVCVLLGCWAPMALRPQGEDKYSVVGICYLHGSMDSEALLGPLPPMWRVQGVHRDFGIEMRYANLEIGRMFVDDPRLGSIPDGWSRVDVESTREEPFFVDYFEHEHTGEVINYDPRLSPEAVRKRCKNLRTFRLV